MSGRKAKALRRLVYGDFSQRRARQDLRAPHGQIINDPHSLRAIYQREKRVTP